MVHIHVHVHIHMRVRVRVRVRSSVCVRLCLCLFVVFVCCVTDVQIVRWTRRKGRISMLIPSSVSLSITETE